MKGLDRPVKASWIYNTIQIVEKEKKIRKYKNKIDDLFYELSGKDGKRKVRTVISRYFLRSKNNPRAQKVANLPIIDIAKSLSYEKTKPLLLFQLFLRAEIVRVLTKMIKEIYGKNRKMNYKYLRKKIIQKLGERDISSRSLRNYLYTMESFDILNWDNERINWEKDLNISEKQLVLMLYLYSKEYINSSQIIINDINELLLYFFKTPDINKICKKYNNDYWQYSVGVKQSKIIFYDDFGVGEVL